MMMKKARAIISLFFLLGLRSQEATAAATNLSQFSPPAGDASVTFLQEMFGSIVSLIASGGNVRSAGTDSVMGSMMGIFGGAVLFLGMLFVGYTSIKATVDSAHDGELLGRKMSSIWIPLRTAAGSALLLPLSSGYSLIQIFILWLALHGVGVADAVWNSAVDVFSKQSMVSAPILPNAKPLAGNILKSEVCAAAMNKQFTDSGRSTRVQTVTRQGTLYGSSDNTALSNYSPSSSSQDNFGSTQKFSTGSYTITGYSWNANDNSYLDPNVCGGVTWKQEWKGDSSAEAIKVPLLAAHAQAVQAMIQELQPVADAIVAGQKPTAGALDIAVANYQATLRNAAQSAVSQTNNQALSDFLDTAKSGGWIYAGTWYNHITRMNDVMQSTLNGLPDVTQISITNKETKDVLLNYSDAMTTADAYIETPTDAKFATLYATQTDVSLNNSTGIWDFIRRLISAPFMGGINWMTKSIAGSNLNHISQMKSFGDTLITIGEGLLATAVAAAVTTSSIAANVTAGLSANLGAGMQFLSTFITLIALALFFLGVTLSTYVPMIPFITWISSVANWFVLVLEAVIAGPIFAVAHIHPDGDDAVGKAGIGYMMILSLVMRPTLMLFGLIGAMLLTEPLTGIINVAFMTVVAGIQADSITGIVKFFAYVAIYVSIMVTVVHIAFSLIHWIPDNILRWIGGHAGGLADAQRQGEESHRVFTGGVHQSQAGAQAGLSSMGKPGASEKEPPGADNTPSNRELL